MHRSGTGRLTIAVSYPLLCWQVDKSTSDYVSLSSCEGGVRECSCDSRAVTGNYLEPLNCFHRERLKFNSSDRFIQFEYFRPLVIVSSLVVQAVESAVKNKSFLPWSSRNNLKELAEARSERYEGTMAHSEAPVEFWKRTLDAHFL